MFDRNNYKPYSFMESIEDYLKDHSGVISLATLCLCVVLLTGNKK